MNNMPCQICSSQTGKVFKKMGRFTYFRCNNCTAILARPVEEQKFYLNNPTYLTNPRKYTKTINALGQRWMIEQFERLYKIKTGQSTKTSLLEIGAGVGFMTLFAVARGWDARGIEVSKEAAKFARDIFRMDVEAKTIESFYSSRKFESIAMVEVLEHFRNPIKAMDRIKQITQPGTFIFGTTPNTSSRHWKISKQNIYVPSDHIVLFNDKSLNFFAERTQLINFSIEYFGSGDKHDSNLMYSGITS